MLKILRYPASYISLTLKRSRGIGVKVQRYELLSGIWSQFKTTWGNAQIFLNNFISVTFFLWFCCHSILKESVFAPLITPLIIVEVSNSEIPKHRGPAREKKGRKSDGEMTRQMPVKEKCGMRKVRATEGKKRRTGEKWTRNTFIHRGEHCKCLHFLHQQFT